MPLFEQMLRAKSPGAPEVEVDVWQFCGVIWLPDEDRRARHPLDEGDPHVVQANLHEDEAIHHRPVDNLLNVFQRRDRP